MDDKLPANILFEKSVLNVIEFITARYACLLATNAKNIQKQSDTI